MVPGLFPLTKYHLSGDRIPSSRTPSDDISLSQIDTSVVSPTQDSVDRDGNAHKQLHRNLWRFFCYFLHLFLVALHVFLLTIATWNHAEHQITLQFNDEALTTGLSGGLQAFYILYTALLVFVTQSLALSATFSSPKKLTQIHDICGAWSGLGAALSTLWSQTKVASSVWSVVLVTIYFACVSVLHMASSTIMQFQPFNHTITRTVPAVATWPGTSVDLSALNWTAAVGTLPFLQNLYSNTTKGLVNNTLYDIPTQSFVNAEVNTTMVNAQCGLLTHLSVSSIVDDKLMSINASMADMDPFTISLNFGPLLNEFWFDVNAVRCIGCEAFFLFLLTATIETDGPVNDVKPVYFNGSYGPADQNISVPMYFIACTLNTSTNTATLSSSGSLFEEPDKHPTDEAWSIFSPGGDTGLTSTINTALQTQTNTAYNTTYCVACTQAWFSISPLQVYMSSLLGLSVSTCDSTGVAIRYAGGPSLADYVGTPSLVTRGQMEHAVSQIAAQFMWMAGQLGSAGGGFDRQTEDCQVTQYILKWRLNINLLPTITSFCASVILFVLVVCMLWNRHSGLGAVSSAGVLEIMWLGSRSRVSRDHLRDERNMSVDSLRVSSVLETVSWPWPADTNKENSKFHATVPLYKPGTHTSDSGCLDTPDLLSSDCHICDPYQPCKPIYVPDASCSRRWCYMLHIILVFLHVVLLVLLVHHPEHSVIIPVETSVLTAGLSAILQAIYTLYCAILTVIMQRLALFRIVSNRQKLTIVHDTSRAWTGFGAAIYVFWQQRQLASSILEIAAVVAYLSSVVLLHIGSSSVLQWQVFNSTFVSVLPSDLAFPSTTLNISQLPWDEESLSVLQSISFDANLSTYGLSNNVIYDMPRVPTNTTLLEASVNATTVGVQCGLVPNLTLTGPTNIALVDPLTDAYQLNFSLDGTTNGTFSHVLAMSKGLVLSRIRVLMAESQCVVCPQTLFYVMTTEIDVDESVPNTAAVNMHYNYTSGGSEDYDWTVSIHVAACSVSARTVPAILNLREDQLVPITSQLFSSSNTSWSTWSPADPTDFNIGVATALLNVQYYYANSEGNVGCICSNFDRYMMRLLWTNVQGDFTTNDSSPPCPIANPFVKLSPSRLEDAIARTTARFLWLSGQLGEDFGGFQRTVGESRATRNVLQWRLNLNTIPIVLVSAASFTALALVPFIIGKKPSKEHTPLVTGTSVLECLWLEAHSDELHSRIEAIEEPRSDRLRAGGMFDIALGDIGRSSFASEAVG